ncbi:helix-hairpin-helix domain-containing protein [Streptococcus dentasini]
MFDDWIETVKEHKAVTGLVSVLIILVLVLAVNLYGGRQAASFPEAVSSSVSQSSSSFGSSSDAHKQTDTIVVDVKGAVKAEGVYELPAGSRVTDAIKKAGGFADNANKKTVNLAQKLDDEAVVYVAAQGEEAPEVVASSDNTEKSSQASDNQDKVNINTASKEELQTISGIGEKRAQDIIDYREEHGGFKSLDELKNISGIGDKTYEKIAPEVTL